MKKIPIEVFSLKNCDPQKWVELSNYLVNEYRSKGFKKALAKISCRVIPKFIEKSARNKRFPYHWGDAIFCDDFDFRYFVHMIAQNKDEIGSPQMFILGVLPFPGETYYTFWIHEDKGTKEPKIDVFSPHIIEKYAQRSDRLPEDIEMPERWFHKKQLDGAVKFYEKDLYNLHLFVAKFIARNKTYEIIDKKEAYSLKEQNKDRKEWLVSLWPDGLTYSERIDCDIDSQIILHKTYLPYTGNPACHSNEEQTIDLKQSEAIAESFALLSKKEKEEFPGQYGEERIYDFILESDEVIKDMSEVCKKCEEKLQFCISYIQNYFSEEKRLKFVEEYNSSNRYHLNEIDGAKKILKDFRRFTKENAQQTSDALICVTKCLKMHIQKYKELESSDFSTSLLLRMQMMSVLKEMAELHKLLNDFFPEQESDKSMKFS